MIDPGTRLGAYEVLRTLGSGAFALVVLARDRRSEREVAIKLLSKSRGVGKDGFLGGHAQELDILKSVSHPNIVSLLDSFDTPAYHCLVLEYVPGGELFDLISSPTALAEDAARRIFGELVDAVGYLHEKRICHRDLKMENILLTATRSIKLTDFGLARRFDPSIPLVARCGSEEYAAPEVIQAQPYDGRKTDIWALGIILFALLTKHLPFCILPGQRPKTMFHKIARADYRFPASAEGVSEDAKDLVRIILQANPARRATIEEICAHPWLMRGDAE
ncbi:kinase-like domain-containing protein [Blyttiomyces helicus]|uniref:Kinase-like domain-containing protein n=1 Tax=Blyttiomyces helicus TaxID=388810 RepID=A0A4P9WDC8_9FUNG|nr:kinase-like domain-containing protein [Blyttiomyces helicus]|eukprot:RKO88960.1 kinase-like domain-containing protein [Blyttiomyces helicus]